MERRHVVVPLLSAVVLLFVLAAFTTPAAAASIDVENTLAQDDRDDYIAVETAVSVPENTAELEVTLPEGAVPERAVGFSQTDDRTFEWTGETTEPTVEYAYEATVREQRGGHEGLFYVDADEWAIVRTPLIGLSWRGPDAEVVRESRVDGPGVASSHMAYLGPYEQHTRTAAGQQFSLVVPAAADLRESPEAILDSLTAASGRLDIGSRNENVFAIAAPTEFHEWGPAGLQRGPAGDMWVRDREPLDTARSAWVHEYVHTRQAFNDAPDRHTDATRWTVEGMADYYAALLSYEAGDIDAETFRDRLEHGAGDEYTDVQLVDPDTWEGTNADYDRGALVFGHIDRRLRAESDTTLNAVVASMNDADPLTHEAFLDAVEEAGGSDIRADAERYTETTAAPSVWDRGEHAAAFSDTPAYVSAVSVTPETAEVGEPITVSATVESTANGVEHTVTFTVDGEPAGTETVTVDGATNATGVIEFDEPGEYTVGADDISTTVTVTDEPANGEGAASDDGTVTPETTAAPDEATPTPGTTDDGSLPMPESQSGFGVVAAVLALLAGVVSARRR
ncbi:probable secreted glycoprotein [Natronomonas pharaonis DSM 2160]|uniref:Probable secreted glycoprotein n=1 Tax=Natronomonas pharaonis (strain ATCC 35678 / DSM 2160 / CIP 103997 / JCM 8858 / NBRC 14720 / NCIMB 2260 / Gabara) TaxID=348780 RepID=A0A1U7ETX8_NATPD|nr:5'-nucleotidase [Natronomonas pharaonis]CAI48395.1 probable secreted glycoprotein [Natronomonas pharaonis DSM 2160]